MKKKQTNPGPKPKYTNQDSARLVGTMDRLEMNAYRSKGKKMTPAKAYEMQGQMDSIQKNPYAKTYFERESVKKGSGGKINRTGSTSKPVSGQTLKPTPIKSKAKGVVRIDAPRKKN